MSATAPRPVGLPPVKLLALADIAAASVSLRGDAQQTDFDVDITGVTLRSAEVRPGDLFLALAGSAAHGADYAEQAARAGAAAILTDERGYQIALKQSAAASLPIMISAAPREVIGAVAAAVYGAPSTQLTVIGITGTSGKTTTSFLLEGALAAAGRHVGLIGTVGARVDGRPVPSALTTPEAPDLQALLAVMRQQGVDTVTMEVSSHALALGRVAGTAFAVGAFTNLSQDHLDFHGDMEHYFAAKKLLFDGRAAAEVVVIDDEYGARLAAERPAAVTVSGGSAPADWTVRARPGAPGIQQLQVAGPAGMTIDTTISLPGAFNVTNALTALACTASAGIDPVAAAAGLAAVQVPGRLQRVDRGQGFLALVDYAHKPGAVAAVLQAVREGSAGRIIIVLGAGGDRDHGKRPLMGEIAARRADTVIITDDNPRSEDPSVIRSAMLAGAWAVGGDIREIGDRREAIRAAVATARTGDVVLIAGKGHEQGQEIAGVVHPFVDADELAEAIDRASRGAS